MKQKIPGIFQGLLLLLGVAGFWTSIFLILTRQSGDSSRVVIQGAGNSGNTIHVDTVVDGLASQLAQRTDFAQISVEELNQIGTALRERALEGDPTAALVMLRTEQLQQEVAQENQ